jgi:hypothetical protein
MTDFISLIDNRNGSTNPFHGELPVGLIPEANDQKQILQQQQQPQIQIEEDFQIFHQDIIDRDAEIIKLHKDIQTINELMVSERDLNCNSQNLFSN